MARLWNTVAMLSHEAINEFKKIWATKYSQELTDNEAIAKATTLLTLIKSIYLPIKRSKHDQ